MSEDEFTRLFKYMEQRFDKVDEQFVSVRSDINELRTIMDGYAIHLDTYMTEMAAMQHKIDRLERMIDFLADKAGVSKKVLEAL